MDLTEIVTSVLHQCVSDSSKCGYRLPGRTRTVTVSGLFKETRGIGYRTSSCRSSRAVFPKAPPFRESLSSIWVNNLRQFTQVFLRSGLLSIYEIVPTALSAETEQFSRASSLRVKFVKIASKAFDIQRPEEAAQTALAEQKRIFRQLIPFVTSPSEGSILHGVFFTGDRPSWILATDKSGARIHPSGHAVVHSFTTCSLWESKGDFLLYTDEVTPLSC